MAALRQIARSLAAKSHVAQKPLDIVSKIDFDVVQKIKFRPDKALWPAGEGPFPVRFFGLDKFNPLPVKINDSSGSTPHAVTFSPQDFDFGDTGLATELPADAGFYLVSPAGRTDSPSLSAFRQWLIASAQTKA